MSLARRSHTHHVQRVGNCAGLAWAPSDDHGHWSTARSQGSALQALPLRCNTHTHLHETSARYSPKASITTHGMLAWQLDTDTHVRDEECTLQARHAKWQSPLDILHSVLTQCRARVHRSADAHLPIPTYHTHAARSTRAHGAPALPRLAPARDVTPSPDPHPSPDHRRFESQPCQGVPPPRDCRGLLLRP